MRTYVAFFTYWAPRSHESKADCLAPSECDFSADNGGRKDDPHFLAAAACAENQPAALKKFRSLLLHLYQTDSRHEVLPSGAAIHLSSLFDLTDVADTAVVLDWSTVTTLDEGARFFPGIIRMPTADAKRIVQPNPTEKEQAESGKSRLEPFVIFPDLR
jgi:hypothetical protein